MTLRTKEAGAREALGLLDLRRRVLAEGTWFLAHPDEFDVGVEAFIQDLTLLKGGDRGHVRVALDGSTVVGTLSLRPTPLRRLAHVAHLEVMVASSHRGQGLGRRLVEEGLSWARECSALHKVSLAVFEDNERAIGLYRSLGFTEEGRRRDEVRMANGTFRGDVLMALFV